MSAWPGPGPSSPPAWPMAAFLLCPHVAGRGGERQQFEERVSVFRFVISLFLLPVVVQSCPTLCDPIDCSMPDFAVLHHLPELAQTHVH